MHTHLSGSSEFSIQDINLVSGPIKGVTFDGNTVQISERLCADLLGGEVKCVLVTYSVVGSLGEKMPKTAIFHLSATQDGPVIFSHMFPDSVLRNGTICFDLLSEYAA